MTGKTLFRISLSGSLLCACQAPSAVGPAYTPRDPQGAGISASKAERNRVELTDKGLAVHRTAILVDGHNELPWQVRKIAESSFDALDIATPQPKLYTDIPRLRQGGVGALFWAAWVPNQTMRTGSAAGYTLEQIDLIHRMVQRYPDVFEMAYSADDIVRIRRKGKIASLIGIEGGHTIENSLGVLRMFHRLGARYLTLTHAETIDWADSATDEARHGGLTSFGEGVVREMNRLGMLVDISHVSADTMRDVLLISRAPIIASHSSAYAIAPHPRNVPDDVLRLIAGNGGVVMVNFFSGFVVPEAARRMERVLETVRELRQQHPDEEEFQEAKKKWRKENPIPRGTVHTVIDHIDHIVAVAGIDHVGLGSDYDGVTILPEQLEDVSCYPYITQELLNRGYSKKDIHKILGGNLLRAMRQAEQVARDWRK
ncbi:MAG: dipeptidase [Planctomycetota bacterium]|jgi:membrane dipeptidase